jgi:hypothetical protein
VREIISIEPTFIDHIHHTDALSMGRSSIKRHKLLVVSLALVALITVVIICIFYYLESNNEEYLTNSNSQSHIISAIVIQPGSSWNYHINYSVINVVITLKSGNFSALQPLIIDDTNFSLFQRGQSYQYASESLNLTIDEGFSYHGDIYAKGSDLVIINNDKNNDSILTISILYQPDFPVPI